MNTDYFDHLDTAAEREAAAGAVTWTTDPGTIARLACQNCFDHASAVALENGADDEVARWAASYIVNGDSTPCWNHEA